MICNNCGVEIKDGARFCHKCGASINPDALVVENEGVAMPLSNDGIDVSGTSVFSGAVSLSATDSDIAEAESCDTAKASAEDVATDATAAPVLEDGVADVTPAPLPATIDSAEKKEEKNASTGDAPKKRSSYAGYIVLGFFIPVIGFILWLLWHNKDDREEQATAAGKGALARYCLSNPLVGLILYFILKQDYPEVCRIVLIVTIIGGVISALYVLMIVAFYALYFFLIIAAVASAYAAPIGIPYNYLMLAPLVFI